MTTTITVMLIMWCKVNAGSGKTEGNEWLYFEMVSLCFIEKGDDEWSNITPLDVIVFMRKGGKKQPVGTKYDVLDFKSLRFYWMIWIKIN